ncbi:MAG: Asp-tRNA(Asn)/Glu-tRNA(Gln) amidotransferase subunit GatA [Betaproteobacteria bacterium]|nr:Asp-tRNA(Asn)/Glu-tRNA(Gln) amidotransferase subunit GatA [Betaproteobacteria bacterium]
MNAAIPSFSDLSDLAAGLARRDFSAVELAQWTLDRLAADQTNSVLSLVPEATLDQAKAAQQRLDAAGSQSAQNSGSGFSLLGLPIAHKDIFVTRSWPTTAASKILKGYTSPFDATVVERLATAGMVCAAKLNCDEFAMGSGNTHSAFGPVKNPWDPLAVPGGSSGGSAAAVAAGHIPAATGTDTGGSIRQPSAMCGLTGIKPTYGRASRWGMIAYASSLDQAGPIARTALDCAVLLTAMCGFDPRDSTSLQLDEENFAADIDQPFADAPANTPLSGLRVGLPKEFFAEGLSAEVRSAIDQAITELTRLGATACEVSLPRTALSIPAYYVIAPAEASSNLSRFDGVRYGHRTAAPKDLLDLYCRSRAEGFGAEVKRRILIGTFVLSHGYYDAYYIQAQRVRRLVAQDFDAAFQGCDLIVGPVAPTVAWNINESSSNPLQEYLADIYTLGVNLAGLPAMSIPVGFGNLASRPRPIGMQLIAPRLKESLLLKTAHHFQSITDWHQKTPESLGAAR